MTLFQTLRAIIHEMIHSQEFYTAYAYKNPNWQVVIIIDGEECD